MCDIGTICKTMVLIYASAVTLRFITGCKGDNTFENNLDNDLPQQLMQIMSSIQQKLENLNNATYTLTANSNAQNTKLEALEARLSKIEASIDIYKISRDSNAKNMQHEIKTMRELHTLYEDMSTKINNNFEKMEIGIAKMQIAHDTVIQSMAAIDKRILKHDADLETELSYIVRSLDDFKRKQNIFDMKLGNVTISVLNGTRNIQDLLIHYNIEMKKHANKLHDNIIGSLVYIDNKTTEHFKISDENNLLLRPIKKELREDFNSYANKVADMSTDLWKTTSEIKESVNILASSINSTRDAVQKSIRTMMHVGKGFTKKSSGSHDDMQKKLDYNFGRVLNNQELFMQSCYRLQMDESQIESEISGMLEKLLDVVEKRIANEPEDFQAIKKLFTTQDRRINKNLYTLNQNMASAFGRFTYSMKQVKDMMAAIEDNIDTLYSFIQGDIDNGESTPSVHVRDPQKEHKEIIGRLQKIEDYAKHIEEKLISNITSEIKHMIHSISYANSRKGMDADTGKFDYLIPGNSENTSRKNSQKSLITITEDANPETANNSIKQQEETSNTYTSTEQVDTTQNNKDGDEASTEKDDFSGSTTAATTNRKAEPYAIDNESHTADANVKMEKGKNHSL